MRNALPGGLTGVIKVAIAGRRGATSESAKLGGNAALAISAVRHCRNHGRNETDGSTAGACELTLRPGIACAWDALF
jgi:hypothetical protein